MVKYFGILLVVVLSTGIYAQTTTLIQETKVLTYELNPKPENPLSFNNQVYGILKNCTSEGSNNNTLIYNAKEYQTIVKNGNKLTATISIGNIQLKGKYSYKSFVINEYLTPDLVSATYNWTTADNQPIESKLIQNKILKPGTDLVKTTLESVNETNSFLLYLSGTELNFSQSNFRELDTYVSVIDEYYNADALLNLINQELDRVTYDSIELLESFQNQTLNNVKSLNQLKTQRFISKLSLNTNDPLNYKVRFGQTEARNKEVKKQIENIIDNMALTYYNKGMDYLRWNDTANAISYFHKSINKKNTFAPSHLQMAQYYKTQKEYLVALDTCKAIISSMKPDTDTRYATIKLSELIIYILIDSTKLLIEADEITKAFNSVGAARHYATTINGVKPFPEFDELNSLIYQNLYNKLVDKATNEVTQNNLDQAHETIDSLANFRQTYPEYIASSVKEDDLLNHLYSAYLKKGENELQQNLIHQAVSSFYHASKICNTYKAVPCTNQLNLLSKQASNLYYSMMLDTTQMAINKNLPDSALNMLRKADGFRKNEQLDYNKLSDTLFIQAKQLKYNGLILEGDKSAQKRQFQPALAFYEEAVQISENVPVVKQTAINDKTTIAARGCVLLFCNQGEAFVEAMQLVNAQKKLNAASELVEFYGLTSDGEVTLAIESLSRLLNQGKCGEALYNYNIKTTAARKFIAKKQFINANKALADAISIAKVEPECMLSDSLQKKLKKQIAPMVYFQQKMIEIDNLINQKEFANAIESYQNISVFYADSCPMNFGISHLPLFDFIVNSKNNAFIDFAVQHYTSEGKTTEALQLLDLLKSREFDAAWCKESQTKLGIALAIADKEAGNNSDPNVKVLDYTQNDKWYNNLKSAYLKQSKLIKFQ